MKMQEHHSKLWRRRLFALILGARNRHLFVLDLLVLGLTPALSLLLRLELAGIVAALVRPLAVYTVVAIILKLVTFRLLGFYRRYWRYASVDEIALLGSASLISWLACILVFFAVLRPAGWLPTAFPKSIPLIDGMLTMLLIGGIRFSLRLAYVLEKRIGRGSKQRDVLVVGAGVAGSMIIKELRANPQIGMNPVAFVDDDPAKLHLRIHGVEVVGSIDKLPRIVRDRKIQEIVIALPSASGKVIRNIVTTCKSLDVASKTIPGVYEILSGSAVSQLRDVQIEDLLRRGVVQSDETNVGKLIKGARVMVTGAGGSIGSELCRQILTFLPKELVLLGHGENSIFQVANELRTRHGVIGEITHIKSVIADIRDFGRMKQVFTEHEPQIIFHAAAHKHVGLMEVNCPDAVTNNVLGTQNLVELATLYNVLKLVMISSDKAVNPTNIMGVTKRIAELVVHDAAMRARKAFVVVRFGNVLGSRGSVVPILKEQIRAGGPVTITHPEATRFFMTIPEAVHLVLQAGAMGSCGETYVLDMGQPIKIIDLARDLIRLSGLREGTDIDLTIIGLQDGEKICEELFYDHERPERSTHDKIYVCKNGHECEVDESTRSMSPSEQFEDVAKVVSLKQDSFKNKIDRLVMWAQAGEAGNVDQMLRTLVPQYCSPPHQSATPKPRERRINEIGTIERAWTTAPLQ